MPTYKNVTTIRKELNGKVVEPNQEVQTLFYCNQNQVGLLKTSDFPHYNPVILSTEVNHSQEIVIPEFDQAKNYLTKFAIHFYLEKGKIKIHFNTRNSKMPLILYPGCKWNVRCFERNIESIFIDTEEDFILYITVEKF